jgi:glycosyltransferase involved in cell wall biosynthesis
MSLPKITIVTPTFNSERYLEATIQSLLAQNYPALEYIIIDGGSTDGTVDIIRKYESHLSYWVSEPDNGMYDALQKGFARSTGSIMGCRYFR